MVLHAATPYLTYSDLDILDLQVYAYWVQACNISGCSPLSDPTSGYSDLDAAGIQFWDGFESGDFSQWTRVNDGRGYLYPCAQAGINGNWGACVERGDNDKRKQLIDETPVLQTNFNVRFIFDPNGISMLEGERFRFMQVKMGAERPFFIVMKFLGGQYQIQLNTLRDDLTKAKTGWYILTDEPHTIEVDWLASSAPAADDGSAAFYLDGAAA